MLVSVITPSYNSAEFISSAICSVLSQTFQNWEMIIADDCSNDNSIDIIRNFTNTDPRIKLIRLDKNRGAAMARNMALRRARGDYIAFLDSDDCWMPNKLEKQLNFMKKKDIAFSFTSYQVIAEDGKFTGKTISVPAEISYRKYLRNTIIGCLTVIINKNKTGYFEMPDIRSSHDMALWLEIMKRGFNAYGLNEALSQYRLVKGSNTSAKIKAAKDVWKVYRKIESLNFIYSIYNFFGYALNAFIKRI